MALAVNPIDHEAPTKLKHRPAPVDVFVGKRIRMRRLELGVTQELLAEKLGVSYQQVQKYEKGLNRVSASMLMETAIALDCEAAYFFPSRGKNLAQADVSRFVDDIDALNVVRAFARIESARVRASVAKIVEFASRCRDEQMLLACLTVES